MEQKKLLRPGVYFGCFVVTELATIVSFAWLAQSIDPSGRTIQNNLAFVGSVFLGMLALVAILIWAYPDITADSVPSHEEQREEKAKLQAAFGYFAIVACIGMVGTLLGRHLGVGPVVFFCSAMLSGNMLNLVLVGFEYRFPVWR